MEDSLVPLQVQAEHTGRRVLLQTRNTKCQRGSNDPKLFALIYLMSQPGIIRTSLHWLTHSVLVFVHMLPKNASSHLLCLASSVEFVSWFTLNLQRSQTKAPLNSDRRATNQSEETWDVA